MNDRQEDDWSHQDVFGNPLGNAEPAFKGGRLTCCVCQRDVFKSRGSLTRHMHVQHGVAPGDRWSPPVPIRRRIRAWVLNRFGR